MKEEKKVNNKVWPLIAWVATFSLGYAIVRYHIVGIVPWKDMPFYISNKAIAMSSFILLAFNFTFGPLNNLGVPISNSWLTQLAKQEI